MQRRAPAVASSALATMAVALILAGCGDKSGPAPTQVASPDPVATTSYPSKEPRPADCVTVPTALRERIMSGSMRDTGPLKARAAVAYHTPDLDTEWLIAVRFSADAIPDQVGVWASDSLTADKSQILSVDEVAKGFTDWPSIDNVDAGIIADPGVDKAKACLG